MHYNLLSESHRHKVIYSLKSLLLTFMSLVSFILVILKNFIDRLSFVSNKFLNSNFLLFQVTACKLQIVTRKPLSDSSINFKLVPWSESVVFN